MNTPMDKEQTQKLWEAFQEFGLAGSKLLAASKGNIGALLAFRQSFTLAVEVYRRALEETGISFADCADTKAGLKLQEAKTVWEKTH